jgi:hypothetical protein
MTLLGNGVRTSGQGKKKRGEEREKGHEEVLHEDEKEE